MVRVTVNGQFNVTAVKIETSVVNVLRKGDVGRLDPRGDNDGVRKARELVSSEMSKSPED